MTHHTCSILTVVTLLAAVFFPCAAEEIAGQTNLVIGLLLPPEEPEAGSVREGVTLGVEARQPIAGPPFQPGPARARRPMGFRRRRSRSHGDG